jgi:xylulokinase
VPLVLGVDSSTQSTKVEVRDADDGTLVATGRAAHPAVQPPRSEQPPSAWWAALRSAVAQAGRRDIAGISVAGQQHGLVVLDAAGAVVRDAKLWNDTESAAIAADLVERMDPAAWAEAVGSVPVAAFTITKLGWLARHEPAAFERLASVLLPHDYLGFLLTGRRATDRGDASGTGYFGPTEGEWRPDLLERFVAPGPWDERLPTVLGPTEPIGQATQEALTALGLTGPVTVGPGTGDNMAAALGIGLAGGDVAMSIGTSGTVYAGHDRPSADPTGIVAGFADATGRFLPLVCTLNATRVTAAVARWLGVTEAGLGSLAAEVPAGAGGVVLVPYLDGERTPNRPDATGTMVGLDTGTSRGQIARAAFEGVACGLLDGLDALTGTVGTAPARIVLVGGGATSPMYRRTVADLSGLPVVCRAAAEHVATGACAQAAAVLTDRPIAEIQEAWDLDAGTVTEPDPSVPRDAIRHRYRAAATSAPDTRG